MREKGRKFKSKTKSGRAHLDTVLAKAELRYAFGDGTVHGP